MAPRLAMLAVAILLGACGSSAAHSGTVSSGSSTATGSGVGSGSASGSGPGHSPACGPPGAHTLAADRQARVYVAAGRVIACRRGSARRFPLGQSQTCLGAHARIHPVAVSGQLVAYAAEHCQIDTGSSLVEVLALSDGAKRVSLSASTSPRRPESYVAVSALAFAPGELAWISVSASVIGGGRTVEVHVLDRRGVRVLDSGPGIAPGRLRLGAGKLSWQRGGAWHTARLTPAAQL